MPTSGGTTEGTKETDPWAEAVPYLTDIMAEAQTLYDSGSGTEDWTGGYTAPIDPLLQSSIDQTAQISANSPSLDPTLAAAQSSIDSNGITSQMQTELDALAGISSGANSITTGDEYNSLYNTAQTQNAGANDVLSYYSTAPSQLNTLAYAIPEMQAGVNGALNTIATGTSQLNNLAGTIPGMNNTSTDVLSGIATDPSVTAAQQYLTGMAQGGEVNPYLTKMLEDQAAQISNQINSTYSGAGRYGSAGHADAMARSIAAAQNPLLYQTYESDRNRMLQASGLIDQSNLAATGQRADAATSLAGINTTDAALQGSLYNYDTQNIISASDTLSDNNRADTALRGDLMNTATQTQIDTATALAESQRADQEAALAALTGQTSVEGQNITNQAGAATSSLDAQSQAAAQAQAWAALLPSLISAQYIPSQMTAQAGEYLTNYAQTALDSEIAAYTAEEQEEIEMLLTYLATITGTAPMTSSSGTTTTETSSTAPWFGPTGVVSGVVCDRDAKTDIAKLGVDEATKLNVYRFRYRSRLPMPLLVGPMAQEVEARFPGSTERVRGRLKIKGEIIPRIRSAFNTPLGA